MWRSKWLSSCHRSSCQPGVPIIIINLTSLTFSTLKAKIKKRYHPKSKDKEKIPPENHMCGHRRGSRWSPSSKRSRLSLLYRKSPLLTWTRHTCSLTTNIFNFTWKFSNQPFHRVCDASWTPEFKLRQKRCSIWSLLQLFYKNHIIKLLFMLRRLGICRDRRDRRSCKSFVSCVNFSRKQRSFLHILQIFTHLNVNFLHNC